MTRPWIVALFVVVGCGEPEPATSTNTAELNGIEGMFEYSIDLPWRMEPTIGKDNVARYDPIPITFAIFDDDTNHYSSDFHLGSLCRFSMASVDPDGVSGTRVMHLPSEFAWMEVTGPDPDDSSRPTWWPWEDPRDPWHRVCHPGAEDCEGLEKIAHTSEWQAQFLFPLEGLAGATMTLELMMWVSRDDRSCDDSFLDDMLQLRTYARVNFAREPLPRFTDEFARDDDDDRWLYGDLHYHSQGTDNEGETGYAYRAVATTLAAMGVDFAFATDHASDSQQIVSVGGLLSGIERRGLRDMNLRRWNAAQQFLHAPDGANAEGAQFAAGHPRMPRVFLGGEVDVMPEVLFAPTHGPSDPLWEVPYGNGPVWNMLARSSLCDGYPINGCPVEERGFTSFTDVNGQEAFLVNDFQGTNAWVPGRQHLVYLPRFVDEPQGFVSSRTTAWGGGSRHLVEGVGVLDEVASKHGVAFLAHPLSTGGESFGPGTLPYTQYQYEKIFALPGLAGLQLWNEDVRVVSDNGDWGQTGYDFLSPTTPGNFVPGWKTGDFTFTPVAHLGGWTWSRAASPASQLFNGTSQWDRLLRWGLDLQRTRGISWLPDGEPRRLFMAGGSDAHGDFNYRREGYMRGPSKSTDDALAKVRNLVDAGAPRGPCSAVDGKCRGLDPNVPGHSQDQIVESLAEGHFSVTDGPALRIVVDRNRNHKIDDADTPMGGVLDLFPGEQLPLLVQAKTTSEFGPLASIDLYVGVDHDAEAVCGEPGCATSTGEQRARTYAPEDHGVRGFWRENVDQLVIPDLPAQNCGPGVCEMADHYWLPATPARSMLRADAASVAAGLWEVTIDPDQFPVNSTRDSRPTRMYVRAFARTEPPPPSQGGCLAEFPAGHFHQDCAPRFAYTNPIWTLRQETIAGDCPLSDRALDRDGDGLPDSCDLFPDEPATGGWTRAFGGRLGDLGTAAALDSQGNVYVVGTVSAVDAGTTIHIEGAPPANDHFTAQQDDAVLLKYNRAGQLVNQNVLHGMGRQVINDITISGDVIHIAGTRKDQTVIDGVVTMSQSIDPFVARINANDLRVEWIRFIEGTGDANARAVAANANGQVVVVGDFSGQLASFQPTVIAEGASDCFIAYYKVNQTTPPQSTPPPPQLQSLQVVAGNGTCAARDVAIDSAGRATAVYDFTSTVKPSLALVRTTSGTDSIVVRHGTFAESFTPAWVTTIGSASAGEFDRGDASTNAIALALDGTAFVAGSFDGWLAVNGSLRRPTAGGRDGFIVHLASNGSILPSPMLSVSGVSGTDVVTSLDVDGNGRLLIAGTFTSTSVDLNALSLVRQGAIRNAFVAWVDASGTASSVHQYNDLVTFTRAVVSFDGARAALASSFTDAARYDDTRVVHSVEHSQDGALTLIPETP